MPHTPSRRALALLLALLISTPAALSAQPEGSPADAGDDMEERDDTSTESDDVIESDDEDEDEIEDDEEDVRDAGMIEASRSNEASIAAPKEVVVAPEGDMPPPKMKVVKKEPIDVGGPYRRLPGGIVLVDNWGDEDPNKRWQLVFGGYLRTQYRAIQDDQNIQFYGRNDGFVQTNARPYFAGRMPTGLGWRFQFEAASTLNTSDGVQPFREQAVRARDAFISYEPFSFLNLQVGQFKPPYNLEELQSTANQLFIDRSVASRGVNNFEGRNLDGMAIDRHVGAQITGEVFFTAEEGEREGPGISYAVAVTNGSRADRTFNDNDKLAYFGRVGFHFGQMLSVGGAGFYNDETIINQQDTVNRNVLGYAADLAVDIAGVKLLAGLMQRREDTQFLSDEVADGETSTFTVSRGVVAQLGYEIPVVHLQPSYRFSTYDPTVEYNQLDPQSTEIREIDALTYHTIGLGYVAPTYPVVLMLNYTIAQEQEGRAIANNQFQGLIQISW